MRRIVAFFLCLLALMGSLTVVLAQRTGDLKPTVYAIRDARVIPEAGKVLPRATIVIRDGIIEAVGPDVKVPTDATVLEGKGMVVYPGSDRRDEQLGLRPRASPQFGRRPGAGRPGQRRARRDQARQPQGHHPRVPGA